MMTFTSRRMQAEEISTQFKIRHLLPGVCTTEATLVFRTSHTQENTKTRETQSCPTTEALRTKSMSWAQHWESTSTAVFPVSKLDMTPTLTQWQQQKEAKPNLYLRKCTHSEVNNTYLSVRGKGMIFPACEDAAFKKKEEVGYVR